MQTNEGGLSLARSAKENSQQFDRQHGTPSTVCSKLRKGTRIIQMALFLSLDLDSPSTFRDFSFYCAQLGIVRSIITRPSALKARPHAEVGLRIDCSGLSWCRL